MKKIPKLQKDQKEIVDEWNDRSARFEKSLKKAEDKLKEQEAIGKEVRALVMLWFLCEPQ